jgi:N-acetylmuramoyl-L-alanine amidase
MSDRFPHIDFGDWETTDGFDYADFHPAGRSGQRYLIELADVIRSAGLEVVEVDGWQTRARGSGGYDGTYPWCVMWHHTASDTSAENDVGYICYGCPDAPVANLYLARDGVVWVCAAGATNTNGTGGPMMMSKGVVPADDMNRAAVSVEMANNGVGQAWPQVQVDAMFRLSLALTDWLGLRPDDVAGHYDWTPGRKIDPARADAVQGPWQPRSVNSSGTWSIDDIRDELWLRSEHLPPPQQEDDPMYLATLSDGTVVVVGSAVRPVSGDEIAAGGPFAGLSRYTPDPSSYWHQWLRAGADEYSSRVMG